MCFASLNSSLSRETLGTVTFNNCRALLNSSFEGYSQSNHSVEYLEYHLVRHAVKIVGSTHRVSGR
jgi:hypothetical protein